MRRPGYLAGYQAFGKPQRNRTFRGLGGFGKGAVAQMPSAPPTDQGYTPASSSAPASTGQPAPAPAPMMQQPPPPAPYQGPRPGRTPAADPATLARIAELKRQIAASRAPGASGAAPGRAPAVARPAGLRPPVIAQGDDDEDD